MKFGRSELVSNQWMKSLVWKNDACRFVEFWLHRLASGCWCRYLNCKAQVKFQSVIRLTNYRAGWISLLSSYCNVNFVSISAHPAGKNTRKRETRPSTDMTTTLCPAGNSLGFAAIPKLRATWASGIIRSAICNSNVTTAECSRLDRVILIPQKNVAVLIREHAIRVSNSLEVKPTGSRGTLYKQLLSSRCSAREFGFESECNSPNTIIQKHGLSGTWIQTPRYLRPENSVVIARWKLARQSVMV